MENVAKKYDMIYTYKQLDFLVKSKMPYNYIIYVRRFYYDAAKCSTAPTLKRNLLLFMSVITIRHLQQNHFLGN